MSREQMIAATKLSKQFNKRRLPLRQLAVFHLEQGATIRIFKNRFAIYFLTRGIPNHHLVFVQINKFYDTFTNYCDVAHFFL